MGALVNATSYLKTSNKQDMCENHTTVAVAIALVE